MAEDLEFWGIVQPDGRLICEITERGPEIGRITAACVFLGREDAEVMRAYLSRLYPGMSLALKKLPTVPIDPVRQ